MRLTHRTLTHTTGHAVDLIDITPELRALVHEVGITGGLMAVTSRHTTTAIAINENECRLLDDLRALFGRLAPPDAGYLHNDIHLRDCPPDEPKNAHAHLLAMLTGGSEAIAIVNGDLDLGRWQSVFLVELDGPRERTVSVQVIGT
jgi:secondary thiamine-phosphate synthase enzyme